MVALRFTFLLSCLSCAFSSRRPLLTTPTLPSGRTDIKDEDFFIRELKQGFFSRFRKRESATTPVKVTGKASKSIPNSRFWKRNQRPEAVVAVESRESEDTTSSSSITKKDLPDDAQGKRSKLMSMLESRRKQVSESDKKVLDLIIPPKPVVIAFAVSTLVRAVLAWYTDLRTEAAAAKDDTVTEQDKEPDAMEASAQTVLLESESALWKERYEKAVQDSDATTLQLEQTERQLGTARQETAAATEKALYWQATSKHHETQLNSALQQARSETVQQLRRLKQSMVTIVEQERAELQEDFARQVIMLKQSVLQEA